MKIVKTFHPQIKKFKNIHRGESCYILCPGRSLNNFIPHENGIFIGCNLVTKANHLVQDPSFKYYFFGHGYNSSHCETQQDSMNYGNNYKEEVDNLGNHIQKFCFVGVNKNYTVHGVWDYDHLQKNNAIPVELCKNYIHCEISENPFYNHSAVFPCIQFALYSGFTQIYIVGADCNVPDKNNSGSQYFYQSSQIDIDYKNNAHSNSNIHKYWKLMYEFKNKFYPDAKFININPIGLIDIFDKDIYTRLNNEQTTEWWKSNKKYSK